MKTVWTKGMDEKRKEEMQKEFQSASALRSRLTELLESKIAVANSELRTKSNYEEPSWAFKQADGIGYERALYEVISLLSK